MDFLAEKFNFQYGEVHTDSQVQACYQEIKDKFGLKPSYLEACKLYAYGVPIDLVFEIRSTKKVAQCLQEATEQFDKDHPKKDSSSINPKSKFQTVSINYGTNANSTDPMQYSVTPQKPRKTKRSTA